MHGRTERKMMLINRSVRQKTLLKVFINEATQFNISHIYKCYFDQVSLIRYNGRRLCLYADDRRTRITCKVWYMDCIAYCNTHAKLLFLCSPTLPTQSGIEKPDLSHINILSVYTTPTFLNVIQVHSRENESFQRTLCSPL